MVKLENRLTLFNEDLARILSGLAYHISPEIVEYLVEKNKKDVAYFAKLFDGKIDLKNWLFDGSDCIFPGIRRYVSGAGVKQKYNIKYKAIIDDNTFPRHIWCFLINGKCYSGPNWKETNLEEFELAHIFTHKETEIDGEKQFFQQIDKTVCPYGEFTSAANVVLLPKGTVRPTDNSTVLKSLFYKRYIELYGESTLNGRQGFISKNVPEWYKNLRWNEPFLPSNWKRNIDSLIEYRKERITTIMRSKSA